MVTSLRAVPPFVLARSRMGGLGAALSAATPLAYALFQHVPTFVPALAALPIAFVVGMLAVAPTYRVQGISLDGDRVTFAKHPIDGKTSFSVRRVTYAFGRSAAYPGVSELVLVVRRRARFYETVGILVGEWKAAAAFIEALAMARAASGRPVVVRCPSLVDGSIWISAILWGVLASVGLVIVAAVTSLDWVAYLGAFGSFVIATVTAAIANVQDGRAPSCVGRRRGVQRIASGLGGSPSLYENALYHAILRAPPAPTGEPYRSAPTR